MHVVATAGHVDHGKSTLVRALTGMEPDRWAEERRRGLTLDLGFVWTTLDSGAELAFVDVPGHERFVPTMLAGVGPVPAVLFVVAADEGWMPQSAEHLAALDALGIQHGVLALTRADLADPAPARQAALAEIATTSLGTVEAVAVSGRTGLGLDDLRRVLAAMVARLPVSDPAADVRLWVDRVFSVRGSGTVVTGTLREGTVCSGDELAVASSGDRVRVRSVQSLGRPVPQAAGVARVALNLRGIDKDSLARGDALLTTDRFLPTDMVDVRLRGDQAAELPRSLMLHLGTAAVPVRTRPLGTDTARLSLARPLPLRVGDAGLLRNAGEHRVAAGVTLLDVRPPDLVRRGAGKQRATQLAAMTGRPDGGDELRRRRVITIHELQAMGVPPPQGAPMLGEWLIDPAHLRDLRARAVEITTSYAAHHALKSGIPAGDLADRLELPDLRLLEAVVAPPLALRNGRVMPQHLDDSPVGRLPAPVLAAVTELREDLATAPFAAPDAHRLARLGLGPRELAAAERAGLVLRLGAGVVLLPNAAEEATRRLAELPQPFTVSAARTALDTTRRVALPLLALLDQRGRTERLPDDRRRVRVVAKSDGSPAHAARSSLTREPSQDRRR